MARPKYCPFYTIAHKENTACLRTMCMLYKNKDCGLAGSNPVAEPEKEDKKITREEFENPPEENPTDYLSCKNKENDACYYKDHGIVKFNFCMDCAQDKFRWQETANKWGNSIIVKK